MPPLWVWVVSIGLTLAFEVATRVRKSLSKDIEKMKKAGK